MKQKFLELRQEQVNFPEKLTWHRTLKVEWWRVIKEEAKRY